MINTIEQLAVFSPFIVSLFSFVGLFVKYRKEDKAKLLLALFMLAAAIYYFLDILRINNNPFKYSYLFIFHISLLLLAVPQVYFYLRELTIGNPKTNRILIHCLPALIFFVEGNIMFLNLEPVQRVSIIKGNYTITDENVYFIILYRIFNLTILVQLAGYYLWSNTILRKHKDGLNQIFSDISGLELNWVKHFLLIMAIWGILGNYNFMIFFESLSFLDNFKYVIDILISILICFLYLFGTIQKSISNYEFTNNEETKEGLDHLNNHKLKEKLLYCIEKQEIYLKNNLTIWDLSREANSNRTYISNLINEEFGMNFNSFVNKYRIQKAKQLLQDKCYQNQSLEKIAELSGFNSLPSFNRAFQKFENTSPGNFRIKVLDKSG